MNKTREARLLPLRSQWQLSTTGSGFTVEPMMNAVQMLYAGRLNSRPHRPQWVA